MSSKFVDRNGNITSAQAQFTFHGVLTNTGSGNTYRDEAHFTVMVDFATNVFQVSGEDFSITAPGRGVILHDTGAIRFLASRDPSNIIFEAGPHPVQDGTVDFCSVII